MNPAPPVTSTFIVRFAVLGTSAREAASLPAPADGPARRRGRSAAASRGEYRPVTMRILVLTTSYPRDADDVAGTFVRDGVEALRAAGAEVRVVSPASFRHYGIAYGDGIVNNLRAAPWKALALPLFLLSFARAARSAARGADVVHAHWLPSVVPAMATGKPVVLQLWGSDAALATRARPLARWLVRRARVVVCASTALADEARALGACDVRVIAQAVQIPDLSASPRSRPTSSTSAVSQRRRASVSSRRQRRGCPSSLWETGHSARSSAGGRVPSPGRARRLLRAGVDRRRPVAARGLRHGCPRGDRPRPTRGGDAVGGLLDAVVSRDENGISGFLPGDVGALRAALERLLPRS